MSLILIIFVVATFYNVFFRKKTHQAPQGYYWSWFWQSFEKIKKHNKKKKKNNYK